MNYAFDPELRDFIASTPRVDFYRLEEARRFYGAMVEEVNRDLDESGVVVDERVIPGHDAEPEVRVLIYRPESKTAVTPALIHIHSGGFVLGSVELIHRESVRLCRALGVVVVSVAYRLAPEHPFPAGLEDCYSALCWIAENCRELGIDPVRIGVMGQSAGGGLSAALALLSRDRPGPRLCFQYLGIPELDDRLQTPSMKEFVDTPFWDRPSAEWSWRYYLGDAAGGAEVSPYAAPARMADLSGLPPAFLSAQQFDPLRDEGILYGLRMLQAGVPVELHSFPGTFHGSLAVPEAQVSQREMAEMVAVLRRGLGVDDQG
ncbi:MAG: esterase [Porticoccaceae bacterium]|nr:esterase [Porticoccaceae bacterium]